MNKLKKAIALTLVLTLPAGQMMMAQNTGKQTQRKESPVGLRTLSGFIVDSNGEPLPGAVAQIKGTDYHCVADIDGAFRMGLPYQACKVSFSFVGMKEKTISLKQEKVDLKMNILLEDDNKMKEVVVNGYYSRNKQTFTGASKTITQEELLSISPSNVIQAIATLEPSITITQNNAAGSNPNSIPDLVIRSTTSLATDGETGLNAPLIVIDGVESTLQALYDIDINDIERVEILKDASATALYGENAANGVIIVERKRGSNGPLRIRYTFTPTVSLADLSSYDLCNAQQKLELERRAGLYASATGSGDQSYYDRLALVASGVETDWIHKPVRNSFSHQHSLSIAGRGSGLDYNLNLNYGNTQGVMKDDMRRRLGMNVFMNYTAIKNLILTLRAGHNQVDTRDSKYGDFSDYVEANPYDSPYDERGNLRRTLSYSYNNPLYEASLGSFGKTENRSEELNFSARYNVMPGLFFTGQVAYNTSRGTSDTFLSPESNHYTSTTDNTKKGSYQLGNSGSENWSGKLVGNFNHNFDDMGSMITVNLGGEIKRQTSYARYLSATGFLSDELSDINYATAYPTGSHPGGSEDIATSLGGFVSTNLVYRMRYFVDGSFRMSGSSKFGANKRYAPFWSTGIGWNLHNEKWAKELGWINTARLRASYGYTGSVKFSSYQAVTTYKYSTDYVHYSGVGAVPYAMSNPDLTWQTTKKFNVGLTSSFLGDRLNVNFDYYHDNTDDMLIDMSLPPSSGTTSVKSNIGRQKSDGIEFSVWGKVINTKDWVWTLSVNGLHNKTTILGISDALKRWNEHNAQDYSEEASPRLQYREGESPTAIYAVRSAGIDPASGKEIFIRPDGSYTYTYSTDDLVNCGDTNPILQGAFSTQLRWKRLLVSASFSYRFGGYIYNATRASKVENIDPTKNADLRAFTERWSQPGDLVPYLNISTTGGHTYQYTDRFVERDNELWFSSLQIRYDVPNAWAKKIHAQKIYASVGTSDLFRLCSAKYEMGTTYPYSRDINFSLSVTF